MKLYPGVVYGSILEDTPRYSQGAEGIKEIKKLFDQNKKPYKFGKLQVYKAYSDITSY